MYTLITDYHEYYALCKVSLDLKTHVEKTPKPSMVPIGCILTVSDKGLGPVLLPFCWFIQEYENQAILVGHVPVLSTEGCL